MALRLAWRMWLIIPPAASHVNLREPKAVVSVAAEAPAHRPPLQVPLLDQQARAPGFGWRRAAGRGRAVASVSGVTCASRPPGSGRRPSVPLEHTGVANADSILTGQLTEGLAWRFAWSTASASLNPGRAYSERRFCHGCAVTELRVADPALTWRACRPVRVCPSAQQRLGVSLSIIWVTDSDSYFLVGLRWFSLSCAHQFVPRKCQQALGRLREA